MRSSVIIVFLQLVVSPGLNVLAVAAKGNDGIVVLFAGPPDDFLTPCIYLIYKGNGAQKPLRFNGFEEWMYVGSRRRILG